MRRCGLFVSMAAGLLALCGCGGDSSTSADLLVSGSGSTVQVTATGTLIADGAQKATILVTVRNGHGDAMPLQVVKIEATGDGNAVTQPNLPTNASGVAEGAIASTVAGPKVLTITVNPDTKPVVLATHPTVLFSPQTPQAIIIDHTTANLGMAPLAWIGAAKRSLHIIYGHTSHGSQLVTGMTGLAAWKGSTYAWEEGGPVTALDLADRNGGFGGASDLGNPNFTAWSQATRTFLQADKTGRNVVIWSWCGQLSGASAADVQSYLNAMQQLETEFPNVRFVYMTGHLDGTGVAGNLNQRNEQIRSFCQNNGKVLYDFADIESYDPDGVGYLAKGANDACDYDSDGNGSLDANWATAWQNAHTLNVDWYQCDAAHTQPLNANRKAYAAWYLFARLAGWAGL